VTLIATTSTSGHASCRLLLWLISRGRDAMGYIRPSPERGFSIA
jgi:hypothetical protein